MSHDAAESGTHPRGSLPVFEADEPLSAPVDGQSITAEFSVGGIVPRQDLVQRRFRSDDVFVRLENTIYGPVSRGELADLLASGELTGYESASSDLQHWTPLLYHPKMALTGKADPDRTHEMLHDRSSLPAASKSPRRISLEDIADEIPEAIQATTPLAAIVVRKARKPGSAAGGVQERNLKLPVFRRLAPESAPQAPAAPAVTAVFNASDVFQGRPPHPSDSVGSVPTAEVPFDPLDDFDPASERPRAVASVAHELTADSGLLSLPSEDFFSANRARVDELTGVGTDPTLPAGSPALGDGADPFSDTAAVEAVPDANVEPAEAAASPAKAAPSRAVAVAIAAVVVVLVAAAAALAWLLVRR